MDEPITPVDAKKRIGVAMQPSEQVARYMDRQAHLEAWRVTGRSGWIRDRMLRPPGSLAPGYPTSDTDRSPYATPIRILSREVLDFMRQ